MGTDSGHSTLPGEDHAEDPMLSLEPEAADAIRELESAVEEGDRGRIKSGHRKDEPKLTDEKFRDLTEVSQKNMCQGSALPGVIHRNSFQIPFA